MSTQAIRWARRQRTGSPVSKAVLYVLADHHNAGSGLCCPSTRTIAEEADTDQRTVRRHLDALAERGLVAWTGGNGRGRNRYVLALGSEGQDPSQDAAVVRGETPHGESRSEAPENRSEALIFRSETTQASDQHKQISKRTTYRSEEQEAAATPPPAGARAHPGGRAREHASPADLNATAASGTAYGLVSEWAGRNRGVLNGHRRALQREVDRLLAERADPALIPDALDEVHRNPRWKDPVKSLRFAYDDVRRRAASSDAAAPTHNATDDNIRALLAGVERPDTRPAIGGPR